MKKQKRIYLDNAATTSVDKDVLKEMLPYFDGGYGNASSLHSMGGEANAAVEAARLKVAKLINAEPSEIVFTSGGSESDNIALKQIILRKLPGKNHIITTKIEHPAVLKTAQYLEKEGVKVTYLEVDKLGLMNPEDVRKAILPETFMVSVMHANNEVGTIEPIEEIAKICHEKGIIFHTDAVQSIGKVPIDVKKMEIDLLSASAHKIHGPKGIGFLYVKKGITIIPLTHGGSHEFNKRAGTENVPGIVGFGKACEIAMKDMKSNNAKMTALRDKLIKGVLKIKNSYLNGHPEKRLPNNAHIRFDFVEGEALLLKLDMLGIEISTGSACSSKSLQPSHVLLSLGLSPVQSHGSLRFSLSKYTTEKEIDYVLSQIGKVVEELRKFSPLNSSNIHTFKEETEGMHDHDHIEEE
jgi:cysteine desulfurase